jgi:hypothetical protein
MGDFGAGGPDRRGYQILAPSHDFVLRRRQPIEKRIRLGKPRALLLDTLPDVLVGIDFQGCAPLRRRTVCRVAACV